MKKAVLIADRHYVTVTGMSFILKKVSKDIVIDYAADRKELLDKLKGYEYDLLILGIEMLDTFFKPFIQSLKEQSPSLKIMIFTESKKEAISQYVCKGVESIMSKSHTAMEIREALEALFSRGYYYPQELLYDLVNTITMIDSFSSSRLGALSERERAVYFYLGTGKGLLEIANTLGLHQSTISTYKRRLFKKLKITSLVDLIHLYNRYESNPE
ncbi:response regulator transcription factor [Chryseobacterium fistulae]|uniref:Transcriptional activator protein ExaE n=1 Tax=Chryseobacterium fistulae TaxID=2675058 RepID=A0A6N4Y123_9FLAO|nr:response regulator transcription factor [Chryseobacterium fistulae]CAA7393633.1 Transcriptional activator protein ExaE [Chryseobacterium fistulae]